MALLVFDIGGTAVKHALFKEGRLQKTSRFQTPKTWGEMTEQMLSVRDSHTQESIEGIAISSPGVVDDENGVVRGISAVPYLHHFPIVAELENLFQLPVSIENDANCAALAELSFGVAKDVRDLAFFVIGSGVGGAVILDRQLRKGKDLFAGEFGLMTMFPDITLSESVSPVRLAEKYSASSRLPAITGADLFSLADAGDERAREIADGFYSDLSRAILNVALILNPDLIVIGGGISSRDGLLEELRRRIQCLKTNLGIEELSCDLAICQYHNDSNLLGAASKFINQFC